jgi:hypothetical protein
MESLTLPGWSIEFDRAATVAAFADVRIGGSESCSCDPCRNWILTREQLLPTDFRALLDQLGIPFDRDTEVYHNCRLESGLHSYGGWYHFVGRVLEGEHQCSPNVQYGSLSVYFHSQPHLLAEPFAKLLVAELAFDAEVPWLSEVPEAD